MMTLQATDFDSLTHETPFGIVNKQIRPDNQRRIYMNALWYNKYGNLLGVGDLDLNDLVNIATQIEPYEVFCIVRSGVIDDLVHMKNTDAVVLWGEFCP